MAINIKEILHPSDSDSIKFEKVNYNFDQILANGGGPQGIQGVKGDQGADGATGVKGQKGELGSTGAKGEEGTAITLWDSVAIGTATGTSPNDSIIIKPKSASVTKSPTLWLGDSDFKNSPPGKTNGEARLTLETGTSPDEVGHFLKYYKNSDHVLNVNHRYDGSTTWFSTKPDLGSSLNSLGIEFISDKFKVVADSEVNITTTSSNITFASGGNIEITGSTGFVNIARPVLVTGYLNVTGTSHIKIPSGTTGDRPTGIQGMIRYNQTLTSFEGYDGTIWKGLGGLIDADQDTYIVAEQNTDEDILRFNVGTVGIVGGGEVATMGEDLSDGTIVSANAIQFKTDQFNQGDIVVDEDQGFLVKAKTVSLGADQAQPANSASAKEFRRLDDYFYQESVFCDSTAVEITESQPFVQSTYGLPALPVSYPYSSPGERFTFNPSPNPKVSYKLLWVHRQQIKTISPLSVVTYDTKNIETNIALPLIEPTTKLSYVKTGHMVQCWGSISFYPVALDVSLITDGANINGEMHYNDTMSTVQTWDDAEFILDGRIAFYFAELATFPYTNASDDWIYFPIPQRLMTSELIDDYNNSAILIESFDFWGAIPPGANYFNIAKIHPSWGQDWWKTYREKGNPYSGSTTDNVGKMLIPYMTLRDLRANQNTFATTPVGPTTPQEAAVTTISFNFSIPTDVKSYDVIDTSKQDFLYAGDNATMAGNLYKEQAIIDNSAVAVQGGGVVTPTGVAGA